jgi:predicted enzyme related to lactoylglutathione lyase
MEINMKRVTGIGGIFFKSKDPQASAEWYKNHLGLDIKDWGGTEFSWSKDNSLMTGTTVWSPFMINYRVHDLHALLTILREEGCAVEDKVEESEFGKFGWVIDIDGNKVELWQPPEGK